MSYLLMGRAEGFISGKKVTAELRVNLPNKEMTELQALDYALLQENVTATLYFVMPRMNVTLPKTKHTVVGRQLAGVYTSGLWQITDGAVYVFAATFNANNNPFKDNPNTLLVRMFIDFVQSELEMELGEITIDPSQKVKHGDA